GSGGPDGRCKARYSPPPSAVRPPRSRRRSTGSPTSPSSKSFLSGRARSATSDRCYARIVTTTREELANLAHLRRARDLMDREYARPLDVADLARAALMSTAHFSRQFRAAYGETPYAYLMTRRIERAKALLRRGELSVTEVCIAVGCTSLSSF